jgi:hypothetical protein
MGYDSLSDAMLNVSTSPARCKSLAVVPARRTNHLLASSGLARRLNSQEKYHLCTGEAAAPQGPATIP